MSAQSDALMQQFRQAVYSRLTHPGSSRPLSSEGSIEQRSILYDNWLVEVHKNKEQDELAPQFLRHWVVADVTSFREIPTDRQDIAANDIFRNMSTNISYAEMLRSVDAQLFMRIQVLNARNEQKVVEKDQRKLREYEASKREHENLLEDTEEARARLAKLLPSDWNGKVFIEPRKDPVLGDIFDIRAERTGNTGSAHVTFMDSNEQATKLLTRFPSIANRWFKTDAQEVNGFAASPVADIETPENKPVEPEPLISKVLESVTHKIRQDGSVLYMVSNRPAFIDHGQQILMEAKANEDEESILAAILLAKEKYGGSFELTGSEEFKRRAIEIMLKHEIDVKLKNPQQDALRRELVKARDDSANGDQPPEKIQDKEASIKTVIGKPADETSMPTQEPEAVDTIPSPLGSDTSAQIQEPAQKPLENGFIPVKAIDWWSVQREAIHAWAKSDAEIQADLQQLGPEPSADQVYWFDKSGKPCAPPENAAENLNQVKNERPGFVSGTEYELSKHSAMSSTDSAALPKARKAHLDNENQSTATPADAISKPATPTTKTKEDAADIPKKRRSPRAK